MGWNALPSTGSGASIELEELKGRLREIAENLTGVQILELADLLHDIIRARRETGASRGS
jgi:hypothetical protein